MSSADNSVSSRDTPSTETSHRGIRRWPALLIITFAALVVLALQVTPGEQFPDQYRNFFSMFVTAVAILALLLWLAFFSRIPFRSRVVAVGFALGLLAIPCALVRSVEFTGDVVPHLSFIWDPDPLAILEAHRRQARQQMNDDFPTDDFSADFPAFRGTDRNGVYDGAPLRADWQASPPKLLWRQPVGEGYSQIVLDGNFAVTIEQRGEKETIACYDARTGRELWIHAYTSRFSEAMGGDGPRATPTIADDYVYALGANGHLTCLNLPTGARNWQVNILAKPDSSNLEWGMAGSPLVLDDVIIVNPGVPHAAAGKALVAYDRLTGVVVWAVGESTAGYASPVYTEIAGVPQILTLEATGAAGYAADGSAELWRYPWETQAGINCSQPLPVSDDRVLITAGYTMGSALLKISRSDDATWSAEPLWQNTSLRGKFSTPVVTDQAIFGLDEGVLVCVDLETGRRKWKKGRYGHGQILLAGETLFIQAENGDIALVAADPEEYREFGRIPVFADRTWNTPALAAGHAFIRNHREMAGYDLTATSPE